jgi:hypothetical protein
MIEIKLMESEGTKNNPAKIIVLDNGKVYATVDGTIELKEGIDGRYIGYIKLTLQKNE